ncbi:MULTISPECIES: transcriptional regulator [unclassified Nocardioides]|uniref:transcriptional regulator n=1 Tax=unclassified Nocardioides TaxID=2615069 RepID=UPI0006FB1C22|nr:MULTISPECIES: transcriptional regulator [unclassified Nocardioides]KQY57027.1 MarR family transcriptional regulator [Nocardioides sp. Root140]KRF13151.1 MarR family transcriptional regulator [Nocardioides sp. Soil796]
MTGGPEFNEVIHAPNRLQICALLVNVEKAEFATIRDSLGVADSVVSKHLKVLADAGYVKLDKPTGGGRVRTWAGITKEGRRAFVAHVAELRRLTESLDLQS